jgi:hypothetical protein
MKTDLIEIFQTIRASLQPYATLGFDNRTNSETVYDLWSNKNVEIDGTARNEVFFTSVSIVDNVVRVSIFAEEQLNQLIEILSPQLHELQNADGTLDIDHLDESLLTAIEDTIAAAYKIYKDKDWVA